MCEISAFISPLPIPSLYIVITVPAGVHGSTPTHVATTEADGSHDIFNISLLFSDISESAG